MCNIWETQKFEQLWHLMAPKIIQRMISVARSFAVELMDPDLSRVGRETKLVRT